MFRLITSATWCEVLLLPLTTKVATGFLLLITDKLARPVMISVVAGITTVGRVIVPC